MHQPFLRSVRVCIQQRLTRTHVCFRTRLRTQSHVHARSQTRASCWYVCAHTHIPGASRESACVVLSPRCSFHGVCDKLVSSFSSPHPRDKPVSFLLPLFPHFLPSSLPPFLPSSLPPFLPFFLPSFLPSSLIPYFLSYTLS